MPLVFGHNPELIAFFVAVAVLWFLIGRSLDLKISGQALLVKRVTAKRVITDLFLVAIAIPLLVEGWEGFRMPYRLNNHFGNISMSTLFMVWAIVLFLIPIAKLTKRSSMAK